MAIAIGLVELFQRILCTTVLMCLPQNSPDRQWRPSDFDDQTVGFGRVQKQILIVSILGFADPKNRAKNIRES